MAVDFLSPNLDAKLALEVEKSCHCNGDKIYSGPERPEIGHECAELEELHSLETGENASEEEHD